MLSSAWLATSFFSRMFSRSSSLSRFAWSRRKPPYAFRQRSYVCSLIPRFLHVSGVRTPRPSSTSACRSFVMICSVLYRFRGILPPVPPPDF